MTLRLSTAILSALFVIALVLPVDAVQAQESRGSTLLIQGIVPYPDVYALGGATVAADGGLGMPDVNPATIGEAGYVTGATALSTGEAGPFGSPWLPGTSVTEGLALYTPMVMIRQNRWAGALHLKYFDLGSVEIRDPDGALTNTLNSYEYRLGVSGAYQLNRIVRVGAGLNLIKSQLGGVMGDGPRRGTPRGLPLGTEFEATTVSLDLGVHARWQVDLQGATLTPMLGASLVGFGPTVSYSDSETADAQTMPLRLGAGAQLASAATWRPGRPIWQASVYTGIRKELSGGEFSRNADGSQSFDPYGPFASLVKTWGAVERGPNGGSVSATEQISRHLGLSVTGFGVFTLRYGQRFAPSPLTPEGYRAFGVGIDLYFVEVDYASTLSADDSLEETTYIRITGRIPLNGSDARNFWSASRR